MAHIKSLVIVTNMKVCKSMKKEYCLDFIPLNLLLFPLWNHHNIMGI